MKRLAERVRERMKELCLTQRQLAEKSGTTSATISRFLNLQHEPDLRTVVPLCRELGLDLAEFLRNDPEATQQRRGAMKMMSAQTVEGPATRFPFCGLLSTDGVDFRGDVPVMNGGDKAGATPPVQDAWWEDRGWNREKIVVFKVVEEISDRYRVGAVVWIEKGVPLQKIENGDDVLVQVQGGKWALRRWRTDGQNVVLIDLADSDGMPIPLRKGHSVFGIVRAVCG